MGMDKGNDSEGWGSKKICVRCKGRSDDRVGKAGIAE